MKARALTYEPEKRRTSMWTRMWEAMHGPVPLTPAAHHEDFWRGIAQLEAAAQELSALEHVAAHGASDDDAR